MHLADSRNPLLLLSILPPALYTTAWYVKSCVGKASPCEEVVALLITDGGVMRRRVVQWAYLSPTSGILTPQESAATPV
jgi:hypothetical protein